MKKGRGFDQLIGKIRSDLLSISRRTKRTNESVVIQYMSERLLYRLSKSKYSGNFILKGGLLLFLKTKLSGRLTRDIEFSAIDVTNDIRVIRNIFFDIFKIDYRFIDGLKYDTETLEITRIREGAQNEGIHISILCLLGHMTQKVQIDIGIGDMVFPAEVVVEFPTLLDMDPPVIQTCSMESVIAEKFEAMISFGSINSRMKDFYDIYMLCNKENFNSNILKTAVYETLRRRKTDYPKIPIIFTDRFAWDRDKLQQWVAFLARNRLKAENMLYIVMALIKDFLEPIYNAIVLKEDIQLEWNPRKRKWE